MRKILFIGLLCLLFFSFSKQSFASTTTALLPTSDGNYSQWNPSSGATHYTLVDETTCNGTTDYNSETTVGQRDSYGISLSSIPNNSTITAIAITPCASKNTSGGSNTKFNVFYRLNGVDSADAGGYSLSSTTPSVLSTTTYSGLTTVKSGSTTLEIGGVYTAGNKGARMSQVSTVITYTTPAPTVVTSSASSITPTGATLSGYVTPNGSSTDRVFRYGTSNVGCSSLPNSTTPVNLGSGTSQIFGNQIVSSLSASTTYYYCVSATNEGGTSYGSVFNFTTPSGIPSVTTGSASSITQTTASVSATINPNGVSTDRYYTYDTVDTSCSLMANSTPTVNIGSGTTNVSSNYVTLTMLSSNTTYYYCAATSSSAGTIYGSVGSFTTAP